MGFSEIERYRMSRIGIIILIVLFAAGCLFASIVIPRMRETERKEIFKDNLRDIGQNMINWNHRPSGSGWLPSGSTTDFLKTIGSDFVVVSYDKTVPDLSDHSIYLCPSNKSAFTAYSLKKDQVITNYVGWDEATAQANNMSVTRAGSSAGVIADSDNSTSIGSNHADGLNVLFGDVHVEWIPWSLFHDPTDKTKMIDLSTTKCAIKGKSYQCKYLSD
ncbi:hypothetical protein ACFL54_09580 [Planctomycetota bacterium]